MNTNRHKDLTLLREPAEPKNWLEKFTGPGTTLAECSLQFGIAILAAVAAVVYPLFSGLSWSWWLFISL